MRKDAARIEMELSIESLKEDFINCFRYKAVFAKDKIGWDDICKQSDYVPVEYLASSLRYQCAYIGNFNKIVIDLSVIIYNQDSVLCVWPVTLLVNEGSGILSTNEKELLPPLFVAGISHNVKNRVISDCIDALNAIFQQGGVLIDMWQTRCSQLEGVRDNSANIWYRRCMETGGETDVITDLYVNLELDLKKIHTCLRKHYKALINKGDILWNVEVLDHLNDEQILYFRKKHIEVAGRETRPLSTWMLQKEAVNSGCAFVIKLTDGDGGFVGESLFEYSRDEGSYSVGVYNRELYDEPVSHVVQWTAIKHMKTLGLRRYRIGQRFYPGKSLNLRAPNTKELSISYFKEGFATDYIHTFIVTNHFNHE